MRKSIDMPPLNPGEALGAAILPNGTIQFRRVWRDADTTKQERVVYTMPLSGAKEFASWVNEVSP